MRKLLLGAGCVGGCLILTAYVAAWLLVDYGTMLIWNHFDPAHPITMVLAAVIVGVVMLLCAVL